MEKYIVFGPLILFFGFFFLLIIGFIGLVGRLFIKGKEDSWKAKVIDKVTIDKMDDETRRTEHLLSLKIQLENGAIHSIAARPDFYNKVKIGDRLEKKKGSLWPEII